MTTEFYFVACIKVKISVDFPYVFPPEEERNYQVEGLNVLYLLCSTYP